MRNKLKDLNNHLFEQLERLNNDKLTGEKLNTEVKRAKSMKEVSQQIINNAKLQLDAIKLASNGSIEASKMADVFTGNSEAKQITK